MDFGVVLEELMQFIAKMCNIEMTFMGIEFTFGNALVWCALAVVVIFLWRAFRED